MLSHVPYSINPQRCETGNSIGQFARNFDVKMLYNYPNGIGLINLPYAVGEYAKQLRYIYIHEHCQFNMFCTFIARESMSSYIGTVALIGPVHNLTNSSVKTGVIR